MRLSLAQRRAVKSTFRDRFIKAKQLGRTDKQAQSDAESAVRQKFGAIPWATLLPLLLKLLPLLLELFKKA